jgi:hypothetical protein
MISTRDTLGVAAQTAAAVCALTAAGDRQAAQAALSLYEEQVVPRVGRYAALRLLVSSLIGVSVASTPDAETWRRIALALETNPVG